MMKNLFFIFVLVLSFLGMQSAMAYDWKTDGERLVYKVKFSFITIGEGEMLFKGNENSYQVVSRAWSGSDMSMFKIHDRWMVNGTHEQAPFRPQNYTINLHENDYIAHKTAVYDYEKGERTYQNVQGGEAPKVAALSLDERDMTSALFYLRSTLKAKDVKVGDVYTLPINHLDQGYTLELKVRDKAKMKTALGKKEVFEIQPILKRNDGNSKRNKDDLFIWVTADDNFVPVLLKSNLKFGSFKAILEKAGDGSLPSSAPNVLPESGEINIKKK